MVKSAETPHISDGVQGVALHLTCGRETDTKTIEARRWVPEDSEALVQGIATQTMRSPSGALLDRIDALAARNRSIHDHECFNLNPATNTMNPRAEALLASGIGWCDPRRE